MIDTVIFDMDGTVLDTLTDLMNSVNYVLGLHNYSTHTLDEIRSYVGNGVAVLMEKAVPGGLDNPEFDSLLAEFRAYYAIHCNDETRAYTGIIELMEELKRNGYKMAIVSNKPDSAVKDLNKLYFDGLITVSIGDSPDMNRKPAPDLVFKALKELDSTPETAVYIGDSEVDYATALNSSLPCISVLWGFRDEEYLRSIGANCFANTPSDVYKLIKEMK